MTENSKHDPIIDADLGVINVGSAKVWYDDDGDSIYPRRFVRVDGKLITNDNAEQLIEELQEVLDNAR